MATFKPAFSIIAIISEGADICKSEVWENRNVRSLDEFQLSLVIFSDPVVGQKPRVPDYIF